MKIYSPASPVHHGSRSPFDSRDDAGMGQHTSPVLPPSYLSAIRRDIIEAMTGTGGAVVCSILSVALILHGAAWVLPVIAAGSAIVSGYVAGRALEQACTRQADTYAHASKLAAELKAVHSINEGLRKLVAGFVAERADRERCNGHQH